MQKYKKLSARILSMALTVAMVCTMLPATVFAAAGDVPLGASSVTDSGAPIVCENHKIHTEDCGYIEGKDAQPCAHLNEDGRYSCAPALDSGVSENTATPNDAEYVCNHSDNCGYMEAVQGADCTHVHDSECGGLASTTATIADVTITGTVGTALEPQTAIVTLDGDTFKADISGDVSAYFANLPNGITVTGTAVTSGAALTVTFSGTPDATVFADYELPYFVDTLALTIPGDALSGGADIAVTPNENAMLMLEVSAPPTPSTFAPVQVNTYPAFVNAMAAGGDIQITGDFSYTNGGPVTVTNDTTLDLNGHTVNISGFTMEVTSGTLTIKDTGSSGKITSTASSGNAAITISGTGKVVLESGTVINTKTDPYSCGIAVKNVETPSLAIKGGNITVFGSNPAIFISAPNPTDVNISGGKITGNIETSGLPTAHLTVSGSPAFNNCTIRLAELSSFKVAGGFTPTGTITLDGDRLAGVSAYSGFPVITKAAGAASGSISGTDVSKFTLTSTPISAKKLVVNGDTNIVLAPTGGVAEIGGTTYDTITSAIAVVNAGDTVKILDNSVENITIDKTLTLDLNGKTLQTFSTSPTINVTSGTLTVDNTAGTGTVTYYGSGSYTAPPTDGVITLNGGSIEVKNGTVAGNASKAIYLATGNGNITVSGGTVSATTGNAINVANASYAGLITIKQDAGKTTLVTSRNTNASQGTILINVNSATNKVLKVEAGSVTNTAGSSKYAVYFSDAAITAANLESVYETTGGTVGKTHPSLGPAVTVGTQTGTLTYGTAESATFAVAASNFGTAPATSDYTLTWFSDAAGNTATSAPNLTVTKTSTTTLTIAPGTANAGTYYFKADCNKRK